jgi:capsular polysaccharide biosynthesis protein
MELTQHEQKILDIVNNHPEILDDPNQREAIARKYGLTEKTLRNRIAEFKKYGVINPDNQVMPASGDIDLVQIIQLIWKKKNTVISFSGLFGFLALVYILVKTPLYTSTITMYPAGDLSSSKAVMGTNLATLAESFGLAGMSAAPNYNIPDIVTSTRIKKEVVIQGWTTQFLNLPTNMISYWEIDQDNFNPIQWVRSLFPSGKLSTTQENIFLDKAILEFEDRISVSESGSGLITINVDMEEPQLAADIANYISQFVIDFVSKVQRTNAFKNRVFIEEQLNNASGTLKESERTLVRFKNSHPEKMDTAELKMRRMGLRRDIEENQTVYLTLRQQFEIARIDEQKEEILINILDEAIPAVKVSKPKRLMTLLIAGFLGFALSIPVILYRDYPAI